MTEFHQVEQEILGRTPEGTPKPSLDRISALTDLLGQPQRAYPVVHLTGTNGKTSTTRMVESLLRACQLRTGRFTSPHLETVTERIGLDGAPIDPERFVATYRDVAPYLAMVDASAAGRVSYFETLTAMAYAAFADTPVDVAVVEVGLGGSWDATNVVEAQVSVVTPISLDHTRLLGGSLEQIAGEKAGIIKAGGVVVLANQPVEAARVLLERAAEVGATVAREGMEFGVVDRSVAVGGQLVTVQGLCGRYEEIFVPLHGRHQAQNAACAIAAAEAFFGGRQPLDAETVAAGFAAASSPGRLELVRNGPTVLLDAAHNPSGARATAEALGEAFDFQTLIGVVAVLGEKDAFGLLAEFEPVLDRIVVTRSANGRSMEPKELGELAVEIFGEDRVSVVDRLDDALDAAVALADEGETLSGGGVLVTGSIALAGEARILLGRVR